MLAVEVSFLTGRYIATAFNDRRASEWPPHPARLFSALAATVLSEEEVQPEERAVLEWLEALPAPQITASEASAREVVTVFVPVNDAYQTDDIDAIAQAVDKARESVEGAESPKARAKALKELEKAEKKLGEAIVRSVEVPAREPSHAVAKKAARVLPEARARQPRTFPSMRPEDARATFVWPDACPDESQRAVLDGILGRLTRLGHSSSLVTARLVGAMPEPTFVPSVTGGTLIRTTRAGQLAALEEAYSRHAETEPRVMPAAFTSYTDRPAAQASSHPSSCFDRDALILQRVRGPKIPLRGGVGLAKIIRRLLIRMAEEPVAEVISGHRPDRSTSERTHLAVVPLPFVGSTHSTGSILGVALILPRDTSPVEKRALYAAIDAWEQSARSAGDDDDAPEVPVHLGHLGSWYVRRLEDEASQATLRMGTWSRPSRVWHSVTPVALDRNPGDLSARSDAKRARAIAEAERSISMAVERIGLPSPFRVVVLPSTPVAGSLMARAFGPFPSEPGKHARVLVHAMIEFSEPVEGPLLVGAGRYFGLGLFRPDKEGRP